MGTLDGFEKVEMPVRLDVSQSELEPTRKC